ncbi:MAG: mannosyltransferase family protein, partial [Anaerolineaceae bacterium]|nr:mannosyltransferase family protein [Anaerolineaceae bacterium]
PHFLIDLWSRWDARWYLSIIEKGYTVPPDLTTQISNVAFFPLYPYLIKGIAWFLPDAWAAKASVQLLIGILLSNLCFLAAAGLLYQLISEWTGKEKTASLTLKLLFIFPTSFYFSCFYTESLFLFLSAACFMAAWKRKWWAAGLFGGLLALTRPQGVFIAVPMVWLYMESRQWKVRAIRSDLAWLVGIPAAVAVHFVSLFPLSGSYWAPLLAQRSWRQEGTNLINDIGFIISTPAADVFKLDAFFWVVFFFLAVIAIWRLPSPALAIYTILLLMLPISMGAFTSVSRYLVVCFPVFIVAADMLRNRSFLEKLVTTLLFTIQSLYFLGWVNYYWIA